MYKTVLIDCLDERMSDVQTYVNQLKSLKSKISIFNCASY